VKKQLQVIDFNTDYNNLIFQVRIALTNNNTHSPLLPLASLSPFHHTTVSMVNPHNMKTPNT
jgi:hypothetical protein